MGHRNRNMPVALPPAAAARRQTLGNHGGSSGSATADLQPLFLPRDGAHEGDSSGAVIGVRALTAEEQAAVAALQRSGHTDSHSTGNYQAPSEPSTGFNAQLRADALERLLSGPAAAGSQDSDYAGADGDEQEHAADSAADGDPNAPGDWAPAPLPPPVQHQQRRQQRSKPRSSSVSVRPAAAQLGAAELLVRPILGAASNASSPYWLHVPLQICSCILVSMQSPCNSDQHTSAKQ